MRRAYFERARARRVWRRHIDLVHPSGPIHCICELQRNRFRKSQRIAGCGKPRCWLCKRDKMLGAPTPRVTRADLRYREWLNELPRRPCRMQHVRGRQQTTAWDPDSRKQDLTRAGSDGPRRAGSSD